MMHGHEKLDPAGSSCEADEQSGASRRGVGGAKGRDRGECAPTKHAPDSEPGTRDTGRWLVYGTELPSIPEVGAVCGKAARTDLCGGRSAMSVPTAYRPWLLHCKCLLIALKSLARRGWRLENGRRQRMERGAGHGNTRNRPFEAAAA